MKLGSRGSTFPIRWCLGLRRWYMRLTEWVVPCGSYWTVCCWYLVEYSMMIFPCLAPRRRLWIQMSLQASFWTCWGGSMLERVLRVNHLRWASMFWVAPWTWSALLTEKWCWKTNKEGLNDRSWKQLSLQAWWLFTNHRSCMGCFAIPVASLPGNTCNRYVWKFCSWEGRHLINRVVA